MKLSGGSLDSSFVKIVNSETAGAVKVGDGPLFNFDGAFGMDSKQEDVFEATTRPLVESLLAGINVTIFAYGYVWSRGDKKRSSCFIWSQPAQHPFFVVGCF